MTPPRALPYANLNFFIDFTFGMSVIFKSTVISEALHQKRQLNVAERVISRVQGKARRRGIVILFQGVATLPCALEIIRSIM